MKGIERGNKRKIYSGSFEMAKEQENEAEEEQEEV
jgi:hypothetical protein